MRYVMAVTLVSALALPAQAGAMIQIDQGIAGARIGNSKSEVQAALGKPAVTRTGTNEFGPWRQYVFEGGVRVFFQGDEDVTAVFTIGRGDRTTKGIGVGSSERALRQSHRNLRCESFEGFRSCRTKEGRPGQRLTDFEIRKGRVVRVTVGIVID